MLIVEHTSRRMKRRSKKSLQRKFLHSIFCTYLQLKIDSFNICWIILHQTRGGTTEIAAQRLGERKMYNNFSYLEARIFILSRATAKMRKLYCGIKRKSSGNCQMQGVAELNTGGSTVDCLTRLAGRRGGEQKRCHIEMSQVKNDHYLVRGSSTVRLLL